MKQSVFVTKTENFITVLNSRIIHLKENMFRLITSSCYNKVNVSLKSFPLTRAIISFSSPPDGSASP